MVVVLIIVCVTLTYGMAYQRVKRKDAEYLLNVALDSWRDSNKRHEHDFVWLRGLYVKSIRTTETAKQSEADEHDKT